MRSIVLLTLILCLAVPALGQDDSFPRTELSVGFQYTAFDTQYPSFVGPGREFYGVGSHQDINLNRWVGFDNYLFYSRSGSYDAGDGSIAHNNLLSISPAAKFADRRNAAFVPFGIVGIGVNRVSSPAFSTPNLNPCIPGLECFPTIIYPAYSDTSEMLRLGGGVDIVLNRQSVKIINGKPIRLRLEIDHSGGYHFFGGLAFTLN